MWYSWPLLRPKTGTNMTMLRLGLALTQGSEDGRAFTEREGFSPRARLYLGGGKGLLQGIFAVFRSEIVPQRLALLSKRETQEIHEPIARYSQLLRLGIDGESQNAGMHLRRRCEGCGGQHKQILDACVELSGSRKHSVIAAPRFGCNPVGYFALHHDDDALEVLRKVEQSQQNVGGDVVGKIANDFDGLRLDFNAGSSQTGLGAKQGIEINRQHVGFDHLDVS